MDDKALWELIDSLSVREKACLCSGADSWTTKPMSAKGIPRLRMADGPHGLRYEDPEHEQENGGASRRATCFPTECALACSFSPELTRQVGRAVAEEALENGVGLVLGPGVNIKRSPLCGRNFEYYSEDPLLAGELAAGFIDGLQEKGVGASIKHYAANNQETLRMSINMAVDERALYEIYLRAFEIAVKKAQPATVMASYNRVNGSYATESRKLLTDILRLRFGFKGAVISDWGAVYNRPAGIAAGLDLEMPASGGMNDWEIEQAVARGELSETELDTACLNLLRLVFAYEKESAPAYYCDWEDHHALAVKALCKSAVLLKNEGQLPLRESASFAIIGEMAEKPRYQGGGSSFINPKKLVSFKEVLDEQGIDFLYTPGYRGTETNDALLLNAVAVAGKAEQVLLFLGLPDLYECEGYDRDHLRLPESQIRLLHAVQAANPNVCVVLSCGAPVEMPWLSKAKSLLLLYLGGEGVGEAAFRLLFGRENPCGKLPETWPDALEDTPSYHHFPMGPDEVSYNESLYVGYRYYDTADKEVLFPFGFGLSYTKFAYSNLALSSDTLRAGGGVKVGFLVKNVGEVAGEEIAQVYAAHMKTAVFRPVHELVGFARVALAPGEEKNVEILLPYEHFAFYDKTSGSMVVEEGVCEIGVGACSREIHLRTLLELEGIQAHPEPIEAAEGPYGDVEDNHFPTANFAELYGARLSLNRTPSPGHYTPVTPLRQMKGSFWGRKLASFGLSVAKKHIHFSSDPAVNDKAIRQMVGDLPFKNLALQSQGRLSPAAAQALLALCNGKGSVARFVKAFVKKPPYRG
ncbi:glycoside hydrolase family 3 C-terminal domain-containing protein [Ruminococcaceae bacterium OttesenSCG-928-I18]|nr:glycoside hydrolase family 3 C-terminal domain-containing protein [Ruminococcaceae bacterium OttesenSCG-928-I18]